MSILPKPQTHIYNCGATQKKKYDGQSPKYQSSNNISEQKYVDINDN